MCGRYTLYKNTEYLFRRFGIGDVDISVSENFNVSPGQKMPVITYAKSGNRQIEFMQWGISPDWSGGNKTPPKLINARGETIFDKPLWSRLIKTSRCLVPADGFYEWKKTGFGTKTQKLPFYIHPLEMDLFSFAGVCKTSYYEGFETSKTYSIITTEPNKEMADIHNRMPVILDQKEESLWLDVSKNNSVEIQTMINPYGNNGLEIYKVGNDVNHPANNGRNLILRINS